MKDGIRIAGFLSLFALFCAPAGAAEFPHFLPETPAPSRNLVVVRWDKGARMTDLTVRSLQGLVNRTQPFVWVGVDDTRGQAGWWLNQIIGMGLVEPNPPRMNVFDFLNTYKHYARGIVIPPTDIGTDAHHVAVARAAVDGLIVGDALMAQQLGLPIVEDYNGQFANHGEMYRYMYQRFIRTRALNLNAFMCERPDLGSSTFSVDYAVQHKLFTFCWHLNDQEELAALEEILNFMPDGIPMLGAPGGSTGYAPEGPTIQLISTYGKFALPSSGADNLSLRTGFPPLSPAEARQNLRTPPTYDPSKVYVCVQLSDGDNSNFYRRHNLENAWSYRGQVPLGWSLGMGCYALIPDVMRWYYLRKTSLDEFFQSISGTGYMFPDRFARGGLKYSPPFSPERKERAWSDFLYRAGAFFEPYDLNVTATHHFLNIPTEVFQRYATGLAGAWGILNGYNAVAPQYGGGVSVVDGMPIFHNMIDRNSGVAGTLRTDIIAAAGTARPAFVLIFWLPINADFDWGIAELQSLPADYQVVLPSEFARFYRTAAGLPDPPPWPDYVAPTPTPEPKPSLLEMR